MRSEPDQDALPRITRAFLSSLLAAWGIGIADTLVLVLSNKQVDGMVSFVTRAVLAAFTYSTLVGLAYGIVAGAIALRHRIQSKWVRVLTSPAFVLGVPWAIVAIGLGKGPGISGSAYHLPVVGALCVVGGVGLLAAQWLYDRAQQQQGRARYLLAMCFFVSACLAYLSGFLYPNSYHSAHGYMLLLVLAGLHAAYMILSAGSPLRKRSQQVAVALVALVLLALGSVRPFDDTARALAFRDSQIVRQVIFHRYRLKPLGGTDTIVRYDFPDDNDYGARPLAPCSPQEGNDYDVILISVDSLRADRMAVTTPKRKVMPNLDRLATRGLAYHSAYSPSPSTSTSLIPLISGSSALALRESGEVTSTLATELARLGYETISYQPFGSVAKRVFPDTSPKKLGFAVSARASNAQVFADEVIARIREGSPRPFFIYHHLLEPHVSYVKHPGFEFGDTMVDKYDSEVAYVDHHIGRIVDAVQEAGRSERTIIAVTADHAEAFYEHGLMAHGTALYEEMVRVPLIIVAPRLPPQSRAEQVSLIDLAPTLLALNGCGWSAPQEGRPLWAGGSSQTPTRPVLVMQYNEHDKGGSFVRRIATFAGDMKLIEDLQTGSNELYSIIDDPGELKNLATQEASKLKQAREQRVEAGRRIGWFVQQSTKARDTPLAASLRRGKEGALEAAFSHIVDKPKTPEASQLVRLLALVDDVRATETLRVLVRKKKLPPKLQALVARSLSKRDLVSGADLLKLVHAEDVAEHARAEALSLAMKRKPTPPHATLEELSANENSLVASVALLALCRQQGGPASAERIRTRFETPESVAKLPVETVRTLVKCVGEAPTDEDVFYLLALYATTIAKAKHSVYLIIEALGRAQSDSPLSALRRMTQDHWDPIRVESVKSIIALDTPRAAATMASFVAAHLHTDVAPTPTLELLQRHALARKSISAKMPAPMTWQAGVTAPAQAQLAQSLEKFPKGTRLLALHVRKSAPGGGGTCALPLGGAPMRLDLSALSVDVDHTLYLDPDRHPLANVHVQCDSMPPGQGIVLHGAELLFVGP